MRKLEARVPSKEEFILGFQKIYLSNVYTRQRQLVRYVLRRIDAHFRKSGPANYDGFNIEHIYPQSGSGISEEAKASLGNLVFLPKTLNTTLGDKKFASKQKVLIGAIQMAHDPLGEAEDWGEDEIAERTNWLAEISYDKVWRV